jgi:hypothetical protein
MCLDMGDGTVFDDRCWNRCSMNNFDCRVCPGRHLADLAVWINVVTILALFDISKPLDKDGKVIEPKLEYETAAIGG